MTGTTSTPTRVLGLGSRGDGVLWLQQALADAGYSPGPVDGIFGAGTKEAVKQFQAANGLAADGVAGPLTYAALEAGQSAGVESEPEAPAEEAPVEDEASSEGEAPVEEESSDETSTEEAPTGEAPAEDGSNDEPVTDDTSSEDTSSELASDLPASGTSTDWTTVSGDDRIRYVMRRLVDEYGYPVNGAAGLVGNLWAESGVLPNRVEGSQSATPMRATDFSGATVDFTAEQIMNRDKSSSVGPARPGIGLAQWTFSTRRSGLFTHSYQGVVSGVNVLFDMDSQIDYLDHELRASYSGVHGVVTDAGVTVDDASDEVLYNFETPGSVLDSDRKRLPRSDSRVQEVFGRRRAFSERARQLHEGN